MVLYSISKVLNAIGSSFLEECILLISNMINEKESLWSGESKEHTSYYSHHTLKILEVKIYSFKVR